MYFKNQSLCALAPKTNFRTPPILSELIHGYKFFILYFKGTGKSTLINMLYNNSSAALEMKTPCPVGGTSMSVTKKANWYFKKSVCYADTVGFGDPEQSDFKLASDLKSFIRRSEIGVHSIIITLRFGRLSKEERLNLDLITQIFEEG